MVGVTGSKSCIVHVLWTVQDSNSRGWPTGAVWQNDLREANHGDVYEAKAPNLVPSGMES